MTALGGMVVHAHTFGPDRMHIMDTHRIAGTDHGRQVMGFMHLFQTDGQVGLAHGQHAANTRETFRIHEILVLAYWRLRLTRSTSGITRILRITSARWIRLLVVISRLTW